MSAVSDHATCATYAKSQGAPENSPKIELVSVTWYTNGAAHSRGNSYATHQFANHRRLAK